MKKIVLLVAVAIACVESDRVYESECPAVTPMSDFDMQRVRKPLCRYNYYSKGKTIESSNVFFQLVSWRLVSNSARKWSRR